MNTLKWLPNSFVSMWIFCMYWNGLVGAVIGEIGSWGATCMPMAT
jgi:hypothetical protein